MTATPPIYTQHHVCDVTMSTVRSTAPGDAHCSHLIGFNDQTYYDPFFPSSPSEEQLLPVTRDLSPDLQSFPAPSPLPSTTSAQLPEQFSSSLHSTTQPQHHFPQGSLVVGGFHTPSAAPEAHERTGNAGSTQEFLSPNYRYFSDNGYTDQSDYSATPELVPQLSLEEVYGVLDSAQNLDLGFSPEDTDKSLQEILSAETFTSQDSNYTYPALSGTATLASHLMSPVLTDSASPRSGVGASSPPMEERSHIGGVGGGGGGFHVTSSLIGDEDSMDTSHLSGQMQHTPALTGSSMGTSPDRSVIPSIARAASPVVRIESYSRGDSPARVARPMMRSGSKRSRGSRSSHLAVQHEGESSDEEGDMACLVAQPVQLDPGFYGGHEAAIVTEARAGLDPLARLEISHAKVPNFKDQEETAQIALKIADVEDWLARSEPSSAVDGHDSLPLPPPRRTGLSKRQRAKSTGDNHLSRANLMRLRADPAVVAGSHIPGPGLLINEESGEEEEDDDDDDYEGSESEHPPDMPESPPAHVEAHDPSEWNPPYARPEETPAITTTPPPLYRAKLWQDPLYDSSDPGVRIQPVTSNEASMRYEQRATEIETMSRVATWGTRRLSESDLQSLFHRFTFREEKDPRKPKSDRRGNFLDKLLPKRSGSLLKRKESETSKPPTPRPAEHVKKDSFGSRKENLGVPVPLQRIPSLGKRPKSPRINTAGAVAAMGNQIAALGASGSVSATGAPSSTNPWTTSKNFIRRTRSRSDLPGGPPSSTNLGDLWTKAGGPPMPTLASPAKVEQKPPQPSRLADPEEDDDEDATEGKGVTIDFSIRADPITPTLEGFKLNVRQLNPRLPAFMIERVAQEQLRRYKKLIDFKVKHLQATSGGNCSSGKHCIQLGGEPTYLPSKSNSREPEHSHTGFSIAGPAPSDEDASALAEGIVTPAQFPSGVPMPPAKRLPAEFECSLCFKVKKFHKPSDWSKHVHEDVQPFTCTFDTCAEPKSFKRKADWVRHENERHRQLEWWQCNMNDCSHKCYRKDNFVQHLVREHKLPEPKVKTAKASKVRGPSSQKTRMSKIHGDDPAHADDSSNDEIDQVWRLVEECRHETPKNPKDEPCKFCGNICNSWKKLTVHLAKHMEQISMPVLNVVRQKDVTPETVISPIERRISQQTSMSPTIQSPFSQNPSLSPYGGVVDPIGGFSPPFRPVPSQSSYFVESADAQPVGAYQRSQASTYPGPACQPNPAASYGHSRDSSYNMSSYQSYETSPGTQFVSVNTQRGYSHPHTSSPENLFAGMRAPTSQPRSTAYGGEDSYQATYQRQRQRQQQQQQQVTYSSPIEAPVYAYRGSPTSYPLQPPPGAPVPMQYGLPDIAYSRPQGDPSVYSQQQQQQQQPSGHGQNYPFHQQ